MKVALFILLALVSLLPCAATADQRSYVWTYEYHTVPKGEAEIESYFTISAPGTDSLEGKASSEHKFELEVGMTDRFDFAIYQVFSQAPKQSLTYDGFQLRARYRIGEKGKYFLDPVLYLEYKGVPDFAVHGFEAKLILARDFGRFNIALNPILDIELADSNEANSEYAVGMNYGVNDMLRLGIEAKGSESGHYIGPVIAHGKGRFWVAIGSAFKVGSVDQGKPGFQLRMLAGIGL